VKVLSFIHGHSPGCSTIETLNGFKAIGGNVYNGTLGIMSLMAPFFIGWRWQKSVK
jgi:cellobiose-specific phosphotransferase system component IIC